MSLWITRESAPRNTLNKMPLNRGYVPEEIDGWYPDEQFDECDIESAIGVIHVIRTTYWKTVRCLAIVNDEGTIIWSETHGYYKVVSSSLQPITAGGTDMNGTCCDTSDIKQPLQIPRQSLIDTLQEHLDKEVTKREEAEAKRASNRAEVIAAIKKFSDDELVNIFTQCVRAADRALDFVQWVDKAKEDEVYVSKEAKPTAAETDLEKYVRVLTLASNESIEVTPSDPVYPLL